MNQKAFASQADLEEKQVSFTKLSDHAYAYTAEGDPNTGIVIGDDSVMVIDTQATPVMAADVIRRIREVTDKPIKWVVLSHYHAVRVLGASAYKPEHIVASQDTLELIKERGEQDKASEIGRFPRLFRNVESVPPGLTWPTITFTGRMTLWLGKLEVQLIQLGRGHTKGDTVVWLPQDRVLFSGDLVEFDATPYAGDAYFQDWPKTLDNIAALKPRALVPGRGAALDRRGRRCQGAGRNPVVRLRPVRARQARRRRRQGPAHRLPRDLRGPQADLRPMGHLRPLPAVRRLACVRRGHAPPRPAHLDRRARRRDVEDAGRLRSMKPIDLPRSATGREIQALEFAYERSPDQDAAAPVRHAVVVVGAGPVGLTLAIDLAQRGRKVLLLDNDYRLSTGSRAICFAKRTLEIWDRLGIGERMVAKGVSWNTGKVFFHDDLLYQFDLLPGERPRTAGVHQPAAVLRRGVSGREGGVAAEPRDPLEEQRRRARAGRTTARPSASTRPTGATRSSPTGSWPAMARARRCAS